MNTLIVALILLAAIAAVYFALSKKLGDLREAQKDNSLAQLVNQNILDTRSALDKNVETMNQRLDGAKEYIAKLATELVRMQAIGKNVEELRGIFMNSKLRGNFGEGLLEDMLADNFPRDHYETQYAFKNGTIVDAIVRTKDGIIPIDSKFPFDNFRRTLTAETDEQREMERREYQKAVRGHIKDISKKYILQDEGTTSFALMYVPSEAAFYEIISSTDQATGDLARQSRVIMVSPNTMSYFLQILSLGLKRARIEENAQKVYELLMGFHQETMKLGEPLSVLAKHLNNAKGAMETVQANYDKLSIKVGQIDQLK